MLSGMWNRLKEEAQNAKDANQKEAPEAKNEAKKDEKEKSREAREIISQLFYEEFDTGKYEIKQKSPENVLKITAGVDATPFRSKFRPTEAYLSGAKGLLNAFNYGLFESGNTMDWINEHKAILEDLGKLKANFTDAELDSLRKKRGKDKLYGANGTFNLILAFLRAKSVYKPLDKLCVDLTTSDTEFLTNNGILLGKGSISLQKGKRVLKREERFVAANEATKGEEREIAEGTAETPTKVTQGTTETPTKVSEGAEEAATPVSAPTTVTTTPVIEATRTALQKTSETTTIKPAPVSGETSETAPPLTGLDSIIFQPVVGLDVEVPLNTAQLHAERLIKVSELNNTLFTRVTETNSVISSKISDLAKTYPGVISELKRLDKTEIAGGKRMQLLGQSKAFNEFQTKISEIQNILNTSISALKAEISSKISGLTDEQRQKFTQIEESIWTMQTEFNNSVNFMSTGLIFSQIRSIASRFSEVFDDFTMKISGINSALLTHINEVRKTDTVKTGETAVEKGQPKAQTEEAKTNKETEIRVIFTNKISEVDKNIKSGLSGVDNASSVVISQLEAINAQKVGRVEKNEVFGESQSYKIFLTQFNLLNATFVDGIAELSKLAEIRLSGLSIEMQMKYSSIQQNLLRMQAEAIVAFNQFLSRIDEQKGQNFSGLYKEFKGKFSGILSKFNGVLTEL
ncbi:hypothetical protein LDC_2718 [sediment metagenome]|uniref:Uncharacterized protein n=1 Tax=sediment metagenome TaxID=749907 RepID=D9PME0_9ZZZZ